MTTVNAIFERLGGPAAVGRAIGKSTEHATLMRRRKSIPVRYWASLLKAPVVEGLPPVTQDDLVSAHMQIAPVLADTARVAS